MSYVRATVADSVPERKKKNRKMDQLDRWKFMHPCTVRIVGPSACGKTTFLQKIIEQRLIHPWPKRIIYFYGSRWQSKSFDYLEKIHNVKFIQGFDEGMVSENDTEEPTLVICDDLLFELKDSEAAANLFMKGSHHLNLSAIIIEQALFPKGKQSVAMRTNTHYTVIFKSPSDGQGVATLGRQMYPNKGRYLVDSYCDSTRDPHTYLIIDSKQSTPDHLRLISNITDAHPVVYVQKADETGQSIREFNRGTDTGFKSIFEKS